MKKRKTAIVFGAKGYLGRHLVYFLRENNFAVKAFDIHGEFANRADEYVSLDFLNSDDLKKIDWNVDCVFMFAGITGTYGGFDNYADYVQVNEIGLLNILDEIRRSAYRPRLIYPSSRLVYKGADRPLKEDDAQEAKTIYAINKIACENMLRAYRNSFDLAYTIYRICVPYGNHLGEEYSFGTIGNFLNQAKGQGAIRLFGDGSLRRTFTHVEDVCGQIIASCLDSQAVDQVYNICGEEFSLKEIATLVARKYDAKLVLSEWPDRDLRIESGHTVFDSQKIENGFHLQLKHSFKDWLARI